MRDLLAAVLGALAVIGLGGCGSTAPHSRGGTVPGPNHRVAAPTGPVSLREIDGGPHYYCANGFTFACNSLASGGLSWDDPSFFPICDDYSFYPANGVATFRDLGLNCSVRVTANTDLAYLRAAGIWAIPAPGEGTDVGSETAGWHIEEPGSWSDITSEVNEADSGGAGRFLQPSFTWHQLYYGTVSGSGCGAGGTMTMAEVMSCPISVAGKSLR